MNATIIAQTILSGAAAGGVYALIAIGFSLIYRTARVFNFAQGDLGALGAYVAYVVVVTWHQPLLVAIVAGCVASASLAAIVERLALRPLYRRGELYTFVSTIGLSFAIQGGIQLTWGAITKTTPSIFGSTAVEWFGMRIVPEFAAVLVVSLLIAAGTYTFLTWSRLGTAMRACAQDRTAAELLGIEVNTMFRLAFLISGGLGALAGILVAPIVQLRPTMGLSLGLPGFIAALLGGLGSVPGAVTGGLLLGIVQSVAVFVVDPRYKDVVTYAAFVGILLLRPGGIFGEQQVARQDT